MFSYFKSQWPEQPVPKDAPSWVYYEVVSVRDVVTRTIEVFSNNHSVRNSIELAEREGPDQREPEYRSLVHGPFLEFSEEGLHSISKDEFCSVWNNASDKLWPPKTIV